MREPNIAFTLAALPINNKPVEFRQIGIRPPDRRKDDLAVAVALTSDEIVKEAAQALGPEPELIVMFFESGSRDLSLFGALSKLSHMHGCRLLLRL